MAITLKDVASVAGVSTATVSRALAGSESVAPQTANHIRTIADDLGYRFDNVARALRQRRSNLVGMVAPDFAFPCAPDFLFALNQELFRGEYVLASVASFGSAENEFVQVERLLGQRMDALLIVPANPSESAAAINIALDEEIPVIQLYRPLSNPRTSSVILDYEAGIEFAMRICRHRPGMTIQYVGDASSFAAELKRDAFLSLMFRRADEPFRVHCHDPAAGHQREFVASFLNPAEAPRLIVCDSCQIAAAVSQIIADRFAGADAPAIVCLDALPREPGRGLGNVIAVEFPVYELASRLLDWINRAIETQACPPETLRMQPFINLSRMRAP